MSKYNKPREELKNWTNKFNLPDRIIRMLPKLYKPDPERMPVTSLIDEPLVRTLQLEKWDEIVMDYSDLLNTIIGISVHERSETCSASSEDDVERKLEWRHPSGITIVGKSDNRIDDCIIDTKTKAVGAAEMEGFVRDVTCQLNVYAFLWKVVEGQEINALIADIIYRDHKTTRAIYNRDYPRIAYESKKIHLWNREDQEQYIHDQMHYHLQGKYTPCSPESRWRQKSSYAVMPTNQPNARAKRCLDTREEAEQWIAEKKLTSDLNNGKICIEERLGEDLRCKYFCRVRSVCLYAKDFAVI